jgi:hypothetical protein
MTKRNRTPSANSPQKPVVVLAAECNFTKVLLNFPVTFALLVHQNRYDKSFFDIYGFFF